MPKWYLKVKIKHLLTAEEDHETVQDSMNKVADAVEKLSCFDSFDAKRFRSIPKGDDFFGPLDYANKLLASMYDFADEHRVWIK